MSYSKPHSFTGRKRVAGYLGDPLSQVRQFGTNGSVAHANVDTVLDDHAFGGLGDFTGLGPGHVSAGQAVDAEITRGEGCDQFGAGVGRGRLGGDASLGAGSINGVDTVIAVGCELVG